MRGKTIIRCANCKVGSDVRLILVFRGIRRCMNCAAVNGVLREGQEETNTARYVDDIEKNYQGQKGIPAVLGAD